MLSAHLHVEYMLFFVEENWGYWQRKIGAYCLEKQVHFNNNLFLTAIGLTSGGSSTVHIYTQNNT
jgi:hypothetical protein